VFDEVDRIYHVWNSLINADPRSSVQSASSAFHFSFYAKNAAVQNKIDAKAVRLNFDEVLGSVLQHFCDLREQTCRIIETPGSGRRLCNPVGVFRFF
jgi:hypothetical protein